MRIAFITVLLIALLAGFGGFFYLGLHPPRPATHTVDRKLNNDQFQTH